jgi:hypothetical protein
MNSDEHTTAWAFTVNSDPAHADLQIVMVADKRYGLFGSTVTLRRYYVQGKSVYCLACGRRIRLGEEAWRFIRGLHIHHKLKICDMCIQERWKYGKR